MTDFQSLYLVLFLCYFMECLVVVEGRPVLFMRLCRQWRIFRSAGTGMGKGRRLLLLNPLPWVADWYIAPQDAYTLTDAGVITVNSLSPGEKKPALLQVCDPKSVAFAQAVSLRGDNVRWTDPAPVKEALTAVRVPQALLRLLCAAQFLLVFLGAPFLAATLPLQRIIVPFFAVTYALSACIALCWIWGRVRAGFGGARLLKALWLFVYPLASMRAGQSLCQGLTPPCHESALARALFQESAEGKSYLAQTLARLKHLLWSRSLTPEASNALARANTSLAKAICQHWPCAGMEAMEPLLPPAEPGALCQCPVCGLSLAVEEAFCPYCPEVRTVACGAENSKKAE